MKKYSTKELVMKLVGNIESVGSTHIDEERYKNMTELIDVINELIDELDEAISWQRQNKEFSIKRSVNTVDDFKVSLVRRISDYATDSTLFDEEILDIIKYKNEGKEEFYQEIRTILEESDNK